MSTTALAGDGLDGADSFGNGSLGERRRDERNIPAITRLTALRRLGFLAKQFMNEFYY